MALAGTLEIQLLANIARLQSDMNSATKTVGGAMSSIERSVNVAKNAFIGLAGGLGVTGIVKMVDEYTKFEAQLKLATSSQRELQTAMVDVQRISKATEAGISATGVLYARIANATKELGIEQSQVARITESVGLALKVSGATASEASSAMLQLSQAFGSGVLRGEEFNSVNEAAPRLMKLLADGIGVPIGALRGLAADGKITSDVLARVFGNETALAGLRLQGEQIQTISGALQVAKDNLIVFVGTQAQASGAVAALSGAIRLLADNFGLLVGVLATLAASRLLQWIAATTTVMFGQAVATRAATVTTLEKANADVAATASTLALTAARVAELRAAVLAATGTTALAIATNGLVPAQARAAAASAAHTAALAAQATATSAASVAGGVARGALGLLGGPIGAITVLLGLGATAWYTWGKSAKDAITNADISNLSTLQGLDKEIAALDQRILLAKQGNIELAKSGGPAAAEAAGYLTEVNRLRALGSAITWDENLKLIDQQGLYDGLNAKLGVRSARMAEVEAIGNGSKAAQWMEDLATKAEKMAAELAKAQKELGAQFTPEIEKRIRAKYDETSKGTAQALKTATDYLQSLKDEAQESGATADQIKMLAAARAAALAPTAALRLAIMEQAVSTLHSTNAAKEAADAVKTLTDANNELIDSELKRVIAYEGTLTGMADANKAMVQEIELLGLTDAAQLTVTQARSADIIAIKEQNLARLQNSEFMSREQIALEEEIRLLKERMGLEQQRGIKNIAVDQAKEATAEWKRTSDDIERGLTDSFFRAFEAGKGFFQTLWDGIKNLFKTTVLRLLITPVSTGITSMLGMSGAANAGGLGGSSLTSSIGIVDTVSKIYSTVTGSFAALGDSVAFAAQDIGAWLVNNTTGALNSAGTSLMQGSGALGTAAGYAAGAAAGIILGKAISGEYSALGSNSNTAVMLGTAIGSIWGPLGAAIGGAIGGLVNRAFGMGPQRTTATGITGQFGTDGANIQNYQDWNQNGGWFRSDKSGTNYSQMDAGANDAINQALAMTSNAIRSYASLIGLSADAINGFSQSVRINLMGLSAEDAEKAVLNAIGNFGEAMATSAYGAALQSFRLANETTTTTLSRLATDLTSVNTAFLTMGKTLMAASLAGADASSKLIMMAGGLEEFTSQTNAYYSAFYSQTERTKNATRQLTDALYFMGLEMPASRDAFRQLVDAQDLMTDAGRATYSVLIALAPAFDEITTSSAALEAELASLASSTATSLIAAFTGRGQLIPALNAAALAMATVSTSANTTTGALSSINSILGDSRSRVLYFGDAINNVSAPLDAAQLATLALRNEMLDLSISASGTIIDFAGLSRALQNVDTRTFVTTVTGVFEVIGERIKDMLGGIADERSSVRDAAINIIGAGGMTAAQISQQITEAMVGMPTSNGLLSAQSALTAADAKAAAAAAAAAAAQGAYGNALSQQNAAAGAISNQQSAIGGTQAAMAANRAPVAGLQDFVNVIQSDWNGWSYGQRLRAGEYMAEIARLNVAYNGMSQTLAAQNGTLANLNASYNASVANANAYAAAAAAAAALAGTATAAQTAAATAAKAAQLAYIASLQQYAVDAGKAVKQLGALRQETVNYYETQKQLADLMNSSASSLRQTVADYRFGLMDPRDQLAQLQERFNIAYSMALSTSGDVLAGYGNEINSLINPLLQKAQEAGLSGSEYASLINTTLARADAVAARLESMAPADYQLESLALLAQIDATLAALESGALTADQIVVNAIKAGSDTTANGLRAVIAAITGASIPAFANGGSYAGGLAMVGENGRELINFNQPGQVYTAAQTRRMFAGGGQGGSAEIVAELRAMRADNAALRQDNANMRSELQAIAGFTNKQAKLLDRWDVDGLLVKATPGEVFPVELVTAGA